MSLVSGRRLDNAYQTQGLSVTQSEKNIRENHARLSHGFLIFKLTKRNQLLTFALLSGSYVTSQTDFKLRTRVVNFSLFSEFSFFRQQNAMAHRVHVAPAPEPVHQLLYPQISTNTMEMDDMDAVHRWRAVFNQFDVDGDGVVPLQDLSYALRRSRNSTDGMNYIPDRVVEEILHKADTDRDGHLDFPEFLLMIKNDGSRLPVFRKMVRAAAFSVVPRSQRRELEERETYRCCPPPLLMPLLSAIELGVFIYYVVILWNEKDGHLSATGPVPFNSPLIYNPYRRYEAWRYLSYMLIHGGLMHICTNLLVQLVLGIPLEMVHGWWRLLLVYLAGVLAGSLGTSAVDPKVYLAGASGGVYALLTAHLASLALNWKEMEFALLRCLVILTLIISDVGVAVYYRYIAEQATKVGYVAHLGGAVAGLLVGFNVLKNIKKERWETILMWVCLIIYAGLMIACIVINAVWTEHFPAPTNISQ